ncbi:unnamed protein product [Vicia faba]|uniref:Uncharacterized protein n=1 Tax=Vicia faba TaxID=3906 RepID=A0AAV1B850_VICFA|nr:unnamed protein product [Vicia faba]
MQSKMEWRKRYIKLEFRDKIESVQLGLKRIVSDLPLGLAVVDENRDLLFLSSMPIRNLEKGAEAGLHQYPPCPELVLTLPFLSARRIGMRMTERIH